jgi:hypothetical protein
MSVDFSVKENGKNSPNYSIDSDLAGEITLEELLKFLKSALIKISYDVLVEEQGKGFDPKPVIVVDNVRGKNVLDVKPTGKIEFYARQDFSKIILTIYEGILQRSPVDSATYIESHVVSVNGELVAKNLDEVKSWVQKAQVKAGDVIRIVNLVPYAGKLERESITVAGEKGSKRMTKSRSKKNRSAGIKSEVRAPNGAYFLTLRSARRQFGKVATFKFDWINGRYLDFSVAKSQSNSGKKFRRFFKKRKKGQYAYPSLSIIIGEGGTI